MLSWLAKKMIARNMSKASVGDPLSRQAIGESS